MMASAIATRCGVAVPPPPPFSPPAAAALRARSRASGAKEKRGRMALAHLHRGARLPRGPLPPPPPPPPAKSAWLTVVVPPSLSGRSCSRVRATVRATPVRSEHCPLEAGFHSVGAGHPPPGPPGQTLPPPVLRGGAGRMARRPRPTRVLRCLRHPRRSAHRLLG
jgi:hypothetical protein